MFGKLLKYEWKANAPLLGILSLAAVGVGILGTVLLRVLVNYGDRWLSGDFGVLAIFPLSLLLSFCFLALVVYGAAVNLLLLYRFYKNKFTDEGYLTFTLPVKPSQIFLSSALMMLVWQLIAVVLICLLVAVMIFCGTAESGLLNQDILEGIGTISNGFRELNGLIGRELGGGYGVISVITWVLTPVYSVVLSMTWVTLGAVLAKKHKILAAIGLSYAGSMIISVISSIITTVPSIVMIGNASEAALTTAYTITSAVQLAINLGLTVGGYFLSTGLMKHKLNLP